MPPYQGMAFNKRLSGACTAGRAVPLCFIINGIGI